MKYILLCAIILPLFSCDSSMKKAMEEEQKSKAGSAPKEGEWITRRDDGSIRTRINYLNGRKHGMSYLYYDDGKSLQLELPYVVGARHGVSKKYFKDGTLYAETSYQSGELHGERTTRYSNGKLKSRITYFEGLPANDLEEYLRDGELKPKPDLTYRVKGKTVFVNVDNKRCKNPRLFFGSLVDNKFFDENEDLDEVFPTDGVFQISLDTYSPSFLEVQDLICSCKSSQGNPLIIKSKLKL